MNSEPTVDNDGLAGTARLSRNLRWLATLLVAAVPLGTIWTWANFAELAPVLLSTAGIAFDPERVTPPLLVAGFSVHMVPGGIAMYGFWRLRQLSGLFAEGRYFDGEAIRCVQSFASAAFAYGLAAPISRALIALIVSLPNPPGERVLLLRLSSDDLAVAFLGGVFFLISRVWRKAKMIADENVQIV